MTPHVTVIILNFNGIDDTRKCLQSVLKTKYKNFSVFVVDNGSSRNEEEILRKEFRDKRLRFVKIKKNIGFSGGNNKILKKVVSPYITLLNNDTIVDPLWMKKIIDELEKQPLIGAAQSKLLSMRYPKYFEYAGGSGGLLDGLGYPYARGRIMFHMEKDVGQYNDTKEIFWASGAAITLRKKALKKSGLLDTELTAYVEEQDLCWRIKKAGYRIIIVPSSVVYHKGLGTWSKNQRKKTFLIHRNNLIVFLEHVSWKKIAYALPLRILLDWASVLFYLVTRRSDLVVPVLAAHMSVVLHMPKILKKRNMPQWARNRSVIEKEMFPGSIVWEYFIRGKRRYSELFGISSIVPTLHYGTMLHIKNLSRSKRKIQRLFGFRTT